jgi:LysR family transcriptional regulator, regulatory protein for tcuABC
MELRQLRYYIRVVELGSMGRAAAELGVVTSALSQQISRLETELATRLLQRSPTGVVPTEAGVAFWRQAQLAVRHADEAMRAAQQQRLAGQVSVGLAPSTASVLALPLVQAMHARYPEVRLHLVESLSGNLSAMLNARQLDMAVLFDAGAEHRLRVVPLLDERLYLIGAASLPGMPKGRQVRLKDVATLPLVMPSGGHGLRAVVEQAFARAKCRPKIVADVDGLAILMDMVRAGLAATVQPGAATSRLPADPEGLRVVQVADAQAQRRNLLASLADEELAPAALAVRALVVEVACRLVDEGRWAGATLRLA